MHPHAQGLVAGWLLDDGGGFRARDFVGKNHGLLNGFADPPTATSGWGPGELGARLAYQGDDDYVVIADKPTLHLGTGDFTIVFAATPLTSDTAYVMAKDSFTGNGEWSIRYSAGTVWFRADTEQAEAYTNTAMAMPQSTLTHGVYVRSGDDVLGYTDGTLAVTAAGQLVGADFDGTAVLYIGRQAGGSYWNGSMEYFYIYNRALAADEVSDVFLRPFQMFVSPFWAWLSGIAAPAARIPRHPATIFQLPAVV